MSDAYRTPWIIVPVVLTFVFAALFFPVFRPRYDLLTTLAFTFVGICVIWASYLLRAGIFSSWERERRHRGGHDT